MHLIMSFSLLAMMAIGYLIHFAIALVIVNKEIGITRGMLYPRESETREVRLLDGIWNFVKSDETNPTQGVRDQWYLDDLSKVRPTIPMPVPASYNDITTEHALRDHVGTVWYDRKFFVPRSWMKTQRVWLRFGSVHYEAYVWLNGKQVVKHEMGHLPFEVEATVYLSYGAENRITVLCDNALINKTIPQGKIHEVAKDDGMAITQTYTFDFFNYAGIHRSVHLYTTPITFIEEVAVTTDLKNDNRVGYVNFKVNVNHSTERHEQKYNLRVNLVNKEGEIVANCTADGDFKGVLEVQNVNPWWPYLMHSDPGYLYTMELFLSSREEELLDVYRLKVGIRTLSWNSTSFLINGRPIYIRGFGKHEDADVRGKGLDLALMTRDFNLLKWIGANAYRTSHYPYSEESMQFADENGIMIIDECSSVNTDIFVGNLLNNHKSALSQLIHRDKNHASVIMWSIANEPRSGHLLAEAYFREVVSYVKTLDSLRPLTAALNVQLAKDKLAQFLDIISFNRYNAWYQNPGQLDTITENVVEEASAWHKKYNKPVLMTEYGADTLEGLHYLPTYIWAEDYQCALLTKHFKAFDVLRKQKWFIGEFVWNFADFKTEETYNRVGGNKKGIFTRNRQPKSAAYLLRQRYYALAMQLHQSIIPQDVFTYIIDWSADDKY